MLVKALGGKPLNVLTVQPTMTVQHLASLGVRRVSVTKYSASPHPGAGRRIQRNTNRVTTVVLPMDHSCELAAAFSCCSFNSASAAIAKSIL